MPVSTRTRFEVFKRDRFTCTYCGRTPPAVLLEVDHVLPRAAGGSDDVENLTTSCWDCNHGKAANLLEEGSAPTVTRQAVEDLEERIAQAKAYAEAMQTYRALEDQQLGEVNAAWAAAFGASTKETATGTVWTLLYAWEQFPRDASIRTILRQLPLLEVIEAVDVAASWADRELGGRSYERTCRYFYGVCWRRIRERSGHV